VKLPVQSADWNTLAFETEPLVAPTGFREYDARWLYPDQINLMGMTRVGMALGHQLRATGVQTPAFAVGHDYREYSGALKRALTVGLLSAGCDVHDVGLAVTPMAYYARQALGLTGVATVTASHNPNGWAGVKVGFEAPVTHGPDEMQELKKLTLEGDLRPLPSGTYYTHDDFRDKYLASVTEGIKLERPLRAVVATGNGTAGVFAPVVLRAIGVDVVPLHCELDWTFPNYNPNPEDLTMMRSMVDAVRESQADLGLGFDGDGDRVGVVDETGEMIFSDKLGLLLARDFSETHPKAHFVVDVKSTGLFQKDATLEANGATVEYWKTGHSYIKRRVHATGALAGFEKSGHFFFAPPIGYGYDDAMVSAVSVCQMLDREKTSLGALAQSLPVTWQSPTMAPECPDERKYDVVAQLVAEYEGAAKDGAKILGQSIDSVVTVNGVRVTVDDGTWGLIRASSNKPSLVVVVESPVSEENMRGMFADIEERLSRHPEVGEFDQRL